MSGSRTAIETIFARLTAIYGARFVEQFDVRSAAIIKGIWWEQLAPFGEEVIAAALKRCHIQHPSFPPTLGELVALCKAQRPQVFMALPPPHREAPPGIFAKLRGLVGKGARSDA